MAFDIHSKCVGSLCNYFKLYGIFIGMGGHSLLKSPATRSVSDLVQLFTPVETMVRDDLKPTSAACRSVSDLIKLFEQGDKNLNTSIWNTERSKSTFQIWQFDPL